jgi:hypothetical protein
MTRTSAKARTLSRAESSAVAEMPTTACIHVENSKDAGHGKATDKGTPATPTPRIIDTESWQLPALLIQRVGNSLHC